MSKRFKGSRVATASFFTGGHDPTTALPSAPRPRDDDAEGYGRADRGGWGDDRRDDRRGGGGGGFDERDDEPSRSDMDDEWRRGAGRAPPVDDRRRGYDDRRGGYDDRRGGYDDRDGPRRGGFDDEPRRGMALPAADRPGPSEADGDTNWRAGRRELPPEREDFGRGGRGGFDDRRGGYDDRRGGYDDRRGGYDDRRGGYDDRRGGYDDRRGGGYGDRYGDRRGGGGYDDRRGGYDDRRGGYDDRRGGYDDRRGGYDDRRGGYDDRRGGYDDRRGGGYGDRYGDRRGDRRGGGYGDRRGGFDELDRAAPERPAHLRLALRGKKGAAGGSSSGSTSKATAPPAASSRPSSIFGAAKPVATKDAAAAAAAPAAASSERASKPRSDPFGGAAPKAVKDPFSDEPMPKTDKWDSVFSKRGGGGGIAPGSRAGARRAGGGGGSGGSGSGGSGGSGRRGGGGKKAAGGPKELPAVADLEPEVVMYRATALMDKLCSGESPDSFVHGIVHMAKPAQGQEIVAMMYGKMFEHETVRTQKALLAAVSKLTKDWPFLTPAVIAAALEDTVRALPRYVDSCPRAGKLLKSSVKELRAANLLAGVELAESVVAVVGVDEAAAAAASAVAEEEKRKRSEEAVSALLASAARGKALLEEARALGELPSGADFLRGLLRTWEPAAVVDWAEEDVYGALLEAILEGASEAEQLAALYAVQAWIVSKDFPSDDGRSVLECIFWKLYDEDILPEDAFFAWKDDEAEVEGKMTAIVELTEWLLWLQTAAEEDDEDDEDDEDE